MRKIVLITMVIMIALTSCTHKSGRREQVQRRQVAEAKQDISLTYTLVSDNLWYFEVETMSDLVRLAAFEKGIKEFRVNNPKLRILAIQPFVFYGPAKPISRFYLLTEVKELCSCDTVGKKK